MVRLGTCWAALGLMLVIGCGDDGSTAPGGDGGIDGAGDAGAMCSTTADCDDGLQ